MYVHIVLLKEQPESQRYSVFNYIKRESGKSKAFILLFSEMISHFSSTFVISSVTRIHWSSRGVEECRGEHSATVSVISCVHIITKSCSYMQEHMCPMLVSCSLKENESICFTRWNYLALSDGEEEVSWVLSLPRELLVDEHQHIERCRTNSGICRLLMRSHQDWRGEHKSKFGSRRGRVSPVLSDRSTSQTPTLSSCSVL